MSIRKGAQSWVVGAGFLAVLLAWTIQAMADAPVMTEITGTETTPFTTRIRVQGVVQVTPYYNHIVSWDFGDGSEAEIVPNVGYSASGEPEETPWAEHTYKRRRNVYQLNFCGVSHHDPDFATLRCDLREVHIVCVGVCASAIQIPTPSINLISPTCPAQGTQVEVKGSGFVQGTKVSISWLPLQIGDANSVLLEADVTWSRKLTFPMPAIDHPGVEFPDGGFFRVEVWQPDGKKSNAVRMCSKKHGG